VRYLALGCAAGLVAAALRAQAPPVFRVQVESIYVDVFVTQGRDPVLGLKSGDFELLDNGVRQRVELVATEGVPISAALVFDTSSSLTGRKLPVLRAAGQAFLDGLKPEDEAALLVFSNEVEVLARPTRDRSAVTRALERLEARGNTRVLDALFTAICLMPARPRPLIVLFSDGEDNLSWLDWPQVRVAAERSTALIHVVGLRSTPRSAEPEYIRVLRPIAEVTGGRVWAAESLEHVKSAFADVAEAMRQRYVLRYEAENVARAGWHTIAVRLRGKKGEVQARRGYWVGG
jgi:VWFA-related protein